MPENNEEKEEYDLSVYSKNFDYTFGFSSISSEEIEKGRYRVLFKREWNGNIEGAAK
jgi:hypothetical protein